LKTSSRAFAFILLLGSVALAKPALADPLTDAAVQDVAKRFSTELICAGPAQQSAGYLNRHWCPVTKIATSGPFSAPAGRRTLLGLSMAVRPGDSVIHAAMGTTDLAILTVGPQGVLLTTLKPSNDQERASLGKVVGSLAMVVKGKTTTVDVPADLQGYLKSFDSKPLHPIKPLAAGGEYTAKIPARIYHITGTLSGESYVVLEQAPDGLFVNLFPITPNPVGK
jgi:hypothetical protein